MARPTPELPEETGPTRRTFLHAGTTALLLGGAGPPRPPARRGPSPPRMRATPSGGTSRPTWPIAGWAGPA